MDDKAWKDGQVEYVLGTCRELIKLSFLLVKGSRRAESSWMEIYDRYLV
jgi:hypothetical protein